MPAVWAWPGSAGTEGRAAGSRLLCSLRHSGLHAVPPDAALTSHWPGHARCTLISPTDTWSLGREGKTELGSAAYPSLDPMALGKESIEHSGQ
ncbi:hypothetical protein SKAU_G00337760 [Synaphobranchus kaupii]|uniref:Uncharacterized protein n=1 Tax=Synaphobranchus kaupii TaxID=118154 RepID=A0A9Q1EMK6_SYNKA|nr:hypothetical protein SKAU_G00337760 [Synaphobranchus kaupii]